MLQTGSEREILSALSRLRDAGDAQAMPLLRRAGQHREPKVREVAESCLRDLEGPN